MADKYLAVDPTTNHRIEIEGTDASAGAGNAGELVALDSNGRIDSSMMPVGIGADTKLIQASENLAAGDFVNIHDVTGSARVRKADASVAAAAEMADGFVLNNVTSGNNATVYFEGANTAVTGLTAGVTYALSHTTPGGVVALSAASTTAGHLLQILGVATSATEINVEISRDVVIRG